MLDLTVLVCVAESPTLTQSSPLMQVQALHAWQAASAAGIPLLALDDAYAALAACFLPWPACSSPDAAQHASHSVRQRAHLLDLQCRASTAAFVSARQLVEQATG